MFTEASPDAARRSKLAGLRLWRLAGQGVGVPKSGVRSNRLDMRSLDKAVALGHSDCCPPILYECLEGVGLRGTSLLAAAVLLTWAVLPQSVSPAADADAEQALVFFVADDGIHGQELWTSDGTEAGTAMVKDIRRGAKALIRRCSPSSRVRPSSQRTTGSTATTCG